MQKSAAYTGGNALLDLVIAATQSTLAERAAVERFESGQILLGSNESIKKVYFPVDMMISTTTLMMAGSEVEVGSIGSEGMSGVPLLLGIDHVPGQAICQVAGSAASLSGREFLGYIERSSALSRIMLRYVQATINLLEISIGCNALHELAARCARWLLQTADRVRRDEFALTQEFLAMMLGVRRATVNMVAQDLQDKGAIRYSRGLVRILDRAILRSASCECYQLGVDRYEELLGQAPFSHRSGPLVHVPSLHAISPSAPWEATM